MRFSKKTDYAIILVDALKGTYFSHEFVSLSDIAKKEKISRMFLEKLAQELREHDILKSRKGKIGGYRLQKNPTALTLYEVISIFEETEIKQRMKSLHPDKDCPVGKFLPREKRWEEIEQKIKAIFRETTFA